MIPPQMLVGPIRPQGPLLGQVPGPAIEQSSGMEQLAALVTDLGGVAHKRQLVAHGATDRLLTASVRFGSLHRARRGWYTVFPPGDPRHEAVRIGGRLTGASLLALHGAWLWTTPPVTVAVSANASRLRARHGATVVWRPRVLPSGPVRDRPTPPWAVPLEEALVTAVLGLPLDEAVALLDWALASGRFTRVELAEAFAHLPENRASIVGWADRRSESFIESLIRATFVSLGHDVRVQVPVGPRDARRIDIVVDEVVALELDGRAFHADTFDADRHKDITVTIAGRVALRCGYGMVRDDRGLLVEAVHAIIRRSRAVSTASRRCRDSHHQACLGAEPWRVGASRAPRPHRARSASTAGVARAGSPPRSSRATRS